MKKSHLLLIVFQGLLLLTACSKESIEPIAFETNLNEQIESSIGHSFIDFSIFEKHTQILPSGEQTIGKVYEGDIFVPNSISSQFPINLDKHYRTLNLVTKIDVIKIAVVTDLFSSTVYDCDPVPFGLNYFGLDQCLQRTGNCTYCIDRSLPIEIVESVREAVDLFNSQKCIDLKFELFLKKPNEDMRDMHTIIFRDPTYWNNPYGGGIAEIPSSGLPGKTIGIFPNTKELDQDTRRHVVLHEMMHTIGFRHSDYFNRSLSCGGTEYNEGEYIGGQFAGAIHIDGTPIGFDPYSLMNSCYSGDGECGGFGHFDLVALRKLYGDPENLRTKGCSVFFPSPNCGPSHLVTTIPRISRP